MSLFEWWGERRNPGAIGRVSASVPLPFTASTAALYARGLIGAVLIGGTTWLLLQTEQAALWLALFTGYLLVAYLVRVRPDYSNVGWLGGFFDHPFRWSDDVNRQLAFLRVVLLPGRFAVTAVRDALRRARGKRVMVFRSTEPDHPGSEA